MSRAAVAARELRERPYQGDHAASLSRKAARGELRRCASCGQSVEDPLPRQLDWFVQEWSGEQPATIHAAGVEWSPPGRIDRPDGTGVTDPGGGNELGSPRFDARFRRQVLDGVYPDQERRPLGNTIAYLERRHPLLAGWLRALGRLGGDWRAVGQLGLLVDERGHRLPIPDEYAEAITRDALRMARRHYPTVESCT